MDHFYIITNEKKDPGLEFTKQITAFLEENGRKCTQINTKTDVEKNRLKKMPDSDHDCLLVIGGDGTVLRAAHLVIGSGVPILGINLGTLGYLAEVEKTNWQQMLTQLLSGAYEIEPRMMLEGRMMNKDGVSISEKVFYHALNEAVIVRNSQLKTLNFSVYVDGHLLNTLDADGVIVSTATGSTAYNLSAGGPIVEPKAQLMLLTPICPHTLNTRSVVLSAEDSIVIELVRTTRNEQMNANAVFDGGSTFHLSYGDRIEIRRSTKVTNLVKLTKRSFLSTLHKKLSS